MTKDLFQQVKIKQIPGLFKDELGGKTMIETYAYLTDGGTEYKKAKGTKKYVIKREFLFENYTDCLLNNKDVYRSQQRFKSYNHDVYTEEVKKTALSSNDDKRLQTYDKIITYLYGTNTFKVCESEMLKCKGLIL